MHADAKYVNPALRQLRDQQVRFAPREKKIEQVNLAERLLGELKPERTYPYDYICYRITSHRPSSYPDLKLSGEEATHDLQLFVEDVSDAANVPADDAGEPVLTIEELSKQFSVSTKTIARWRRQGLISRRFVFDGRKRVGFLKSSVDNFVNSNRVRIERGSQFSQLSTEERDELVEYARRLAQNGGCPSTIIKKIADETGRSPETIRYTIRQFNEEHPDAAVFRDLGRQSLSVEAKRTIFEQMQKGKSVEYLAEKYCRTPSSVYRIAAEMRAAHIMELPLDCIPNEQFEDPEMEQEILGPTPPSEKPAKKTRIPSGLPPYLASLYEIPLLTREQEAHLFRKMNFFKFKAAKLREKLDPHNPCSELMTEIESMYDKAVETKNDIIQANLRLVVSIAKRHLGQTENFFELVSDGNMSLIRAVDKFDFARGNKFSTYASWAVMKNYARTIPDEHRHRDRFRTSPDEVFYAKEDERTKELEEEVAQIDRERQVRRILTCLDDRERRIVEDRFGIGQERDSLTLREVGARIGVTKERVRQIEARALGKLRKAAKEERIESAD